MTLILFIYLIGCLSAYRLTKIVCIEVTKSWTIRDRKFALFMSSLSWITFITAFITLIIQSGDNDKPANW